MRLLFVSAVLCMLVSLLLLSLSKIAIPDNLSGISKDSPLALSFKSPLVHSETFKKVKFYILEDIPGVTHHNIRTCTPGLDGPSWKDLFSTLYNSPERVHDMTEARIFFNAFHLMFSRSCSQKWTTDRYNNLESVERYSELAVDYFHSLKDNGTIASDSRFFIFSSLAYWTKTVDYNTNRYRDISFSNTDAVRGGLHPGLRGANDLTFDPSLVPHCLDRPDPNQTMPSCEAYDNFAFFKGRTTQRHAYNSTRDAFWQFASDEDPLNYRVPYIRKKFISALDTAQARSMSVIVQNNLPKMKKTVYKHRLTHSHYCFHLPGESSFSCRFYTSLRFGCIPVLINGGWVLPYAPLIEWDKLVIYIDERFNFSDVGALVATINAEADRLAQAHYEGSLCNWHKTIWDVGHTFFGGLDSTAQFTKVIDAAKLIWMRRELSLH